MDIPIVLKVDQHQREATLQLTIVVKVQTEAQAPAQPAGRELLTVKDACALAGVGRSTAYQLLRSGAWQSVRLGVRGVRVRRSELMKWIFELPTP
jgi:excisionase family DNA binding protein